MRCPVQIGLLFFCLYIEAIPSTSHAERLFQENLFQDALSAYQTAFEQIEDRHSNLAAAILLRAAQCHMELHEYQKAADILNSLESPFLKKERSIVLAKAYRHLQNYQKALDILLAEPADPEAQLEMGLNYFYLNQPQKARTIMNPLENELAILYLARLDLQENKGEDAQKRLEKLIFSNDNKLHDEIAYWQGMASLMLQKQEEAASFFEKSLSEITSEWREDALYQLARCRGNPEILEDLIAASPQKKYLLALGEVFCKQNNYELAEQLFIKQGLINDPEALKILAKTAPTYEERNRLYTRLIGNDAQGWFLKGMNNYREGLWEAAINDFQKARELKPSIKFEALAHYHLGTESSLKQGWDLLLPSIQNEEIYPLIILIGTDIIKLNPSFSLNELERLEPSESVLHVQGTLYYCQKRFEKADGAWEALITKYPDSKLSGEAFFWRGKCAERMGKYDEMKKLFEIIYTHNPQSPFAPQAYFNYYSAREYMAGGRKALRHLQAMPSLYPKDPLLIMAFYFQGLNFKKDRFSEEGKLVQHKNLTAAIDAFQQAETLFETIQIPDKEKEHYLKIRHRANLERALANFAIAKESEGTKKHIYLEYAAEVFENLLKNRHLNGVAEEAMFNLAKVYLEKGDTQKGINLFDQLLNQFPNTSYFSSRVWMEKGILELQKKDWNKALYCFEQSEKGKDYLSPDEKLELWIQQSLCYQEMGKYADAMRILSNVVNDEAISSLRVKAMFLRAELYKLQGKPELAVKQLEAIAKKGGLWGEKAKEQLLSEKKKKRGNKRKKEKILK